MIRIQFVSSAYLKLEVLPKPSYHGFKDEADFHETFFESCQEWADISEAMVEDALKEAMEHGLSALDALHIVAAVSVGADEFLTLEGPTKPIHRTKRLKVVPVGNQ